VTRFSGRLAPPHGGGIPNFPDDVAREAYSHEVTSVGFWPGTRASPEPIFYAYAYPTPAEFATATVEPEAAFWLAELGEFALPYAAVASSADPDGDLLAFFESTHAAAADLAEWDRAALECGEPHGPEWWRGRPHDEPARIDVAAEPDAVVVRDAPDRHRYVIEMDGREVGKAVYQRHGDRWYFVHTDIDPSVDGRGLGSRLVRTALDDVDRQGGSVVPLCPFVRTWIERHPEYERLVDRALLDSLLAER
jgi:predicted GNAT family acetyltransferase